MTTRKETLPKLTDLITFVREQAKILNRTKSLNTVASKQIAVFNKNTHSFVLQQPIKGFSTSNLAENGSTRRTCILCNKPEHQFYYTSLQQIDAFLPEYIELRINKTRIRLFLYSIGNTNTQSVSTIQNLWPILKTIIREAIETHKNEFSLNVRGDNNR